jgi:hypothetical protein
MDGEHRDLLMKTSELIKASRNEVSRLHEAIERTRSTVEGSHKLLSRILSSAPRVKEKEPAQRL